MITPWSVLSAMLKFSHTMTLEVSHCSQLAYPQTLLPKSSNEDGTRATTKEFGGDGAPIYLHRFDQYLHLWYYTSQYWFLSCYMNIPMSFAVQHYTFHDI